MENAVRVITSFGTGKRIEKVETVEDTIVFSGTTHEEFAKTITGRIIKNAGRYGKCFYLELDEEGKMPVFHFGMTGMVQVQGECPTYYKEGPKSIGTEWPPRFVKFILHLIDDATESTAKLAFSDARRLGRIRLCASPLNEPPISELGFDPILSMPTLNEFTPLVLRRSCPIKALLLDQSFSAGVGNWVADEILYNARIHPEQRCNTLSSEQLTALHHQTRSVCELAVAVHADDSRFPEHWLFKHRWGKGKKEKHTLKLPSGEPATIKWLTVGGRTSAYVSELQQLPASNANNRTQRPQRKPQPTEDGSESPLTDLTESDTEAPVKRKRKTPLKKSETAPATRRKTSQGL